MTYIDDARRVLERELPDQPAELLDLYLLLALRTGAKTAPQDVHDAWAIWRSRTRPNHPALMPFSELHPNTQRLDDDYVEAIRRTASAVTE